MIAVTLYFNVSFISWSLIDAQDFAMSEMSTPNGMAKVRIKFENHTPFGGFFYHGAFIRSFGFYYRVRSYILCGIEPCSVYIDLDFCRCCHREFCLFSFGFTEYIMFMAGALGYVYISKR